MKFYGLYAGLLCSVALLSGSCTKQGDNSDFDFGDDFDKEDVYSDGYGRLPESLRLATWNLHRCEGPSQTSGTDNSDYNGIAKAISLMSPDVISLQELEKNTTWHNADQLKELADRTGMAYRYCKTIDYKGGDYGIGILYDSSLGSPEFEERDLPGEEARKFLVAEFPDFVFIATHFCHKSNANRESSVKIITDYVQENLRDYTGPIYLAGDLNESDTNSGTIKSLFENWTSLGVTTGTFFNTSVPSRIDYVLVYKGNSAVCEKLGTAVPSYEGVNFNTLSDHYPVIVDIKKREI